MSKLCLHVTVLEVVRCVRVLCGASFLLSIGPHGEGSSQWTKYWLVVAEATLLGLDNHTLLRTSLPKTVTREFPCVTGYVKLCFAVGGNTFRII